MTILMIPLFQSFTMVLIILVLARLVLHVALVPVLLLESHVLKFKTCMDNEAIPW